MINFLTESYFRVEDLDLAQLLRQVFTKCEYSVIERLQFRSFFSHVSEITSRLALSLEDCMRNIMVKGVGFGRILPSCDVLLSLCT